jgi:hypothetical protein
MSQQEEAGFRDLYAPRAAGSVEEPLPDDALELPDLLADGRLRVAQLACGATE